MEKSHNINKLATINHDTIGHSFSAELSVQSDTIAEFPSYAANDISMMQDISADRCPSKQSIKE